MGSGARAATVRNLTDMGGRSGESAPVDPRAASVTVRAARPSDLAAVVAIERAAFSDPWPESAFRDALAGDRMYFRVAAVEGGLEVAGYVIGWFAGGDGEIANIAVDERARGCGVGGTLLDAALQAARERGAETVHLEVRESNVVARALYASRAFQGVGRRRGYYREPSEDAIVLRCVLEPRLGGVAAAP